MNNTHLHALEHLVAVTRPALAVAPTTYLDDLRRNLVAAGVRAAVTRRDTAPIFDWLVGLISLQGISDATAFDYDARHGGIRHAEIAGALRGDPSCPRLSCHWTFDACGYRKGVGTCAEPDHRRRCPLPTHPLRKGVLNQAAYSLFLFVRDVCGGDLVGWIDGRLAAADPGPRSRDRGHRMRMALLNPLRNVHGVSDKLLSMMLSDLLLGGDPGRERWVTAGAGLIAVDTLVHNFLHRTGTLHRLGAEHPYGPGCYDPNGCRSVIEALAERIDARAFNPSFPASFPRFVQHAIWRFCSVGVLDVCNGNRIDDRGRCENAYCPAFDECDRVALHRAPSGVLARAGLVSV